MHEIDFSNARANIAFRADAGKPWHGLGQTIPDAASLEECMVLGGLNFEACSAPIEWQHAGATVRHPSMRALFRSDTGKDLGLVSNNYKIVQPREVVEFFRSLTERHGWRIETLGSLRGGKKVWCLARIAEAAQTVIDGDQGADGVLPYCLLATSFDGSLATTAKFTAVRVVCWNTLSMSVHAQEAGKTIRVPHNLTFNANNVQASLDIFHSAWDDWLGDARRMAQNALSGERADAFLCQLLGSAKKDPEDLREGATYRRLMALFEGEAIGAQLTGGRTEWAMLNAVTQFVDHERANSDDARMEAAWFGAGDKLKSRAFNLLAAEGDSAEGVEEEVAESLDAAVV